MATQSQQVTGWRAALPAGVRPYTESAPIAALFLGISSGFPYAMIGATLTTRLEQGGIDKSTITAFTLVFLAYNFKFLWAWIIDGVRIPDPRPARPARLVDARHGRAGDRGGRQPRAGRSRGKHRVRRHRGDPGRRSRVPASTSSSTPIGSKSSSRASSASAPACRNMAGASARPAPARSRWSSRPGQAGRRPISPAPRSPCPRC